MFTSFTMNLSVVPLHLSMSNLLINDDLSDSIESSRVWLITFTFLSTSFTQYHKESRRTPCRHTIKSYIILRNVISSDRVARCQGHRRNEFFVVETILTFNRRVCTPEESERFLVSESRPIFKRHWHLHVDEPSRVCTPRTHALRIHTHACPSTRTILLLRLDNDKGKGVDAICVHCSPIGCTDIILFLFQTFFFLFRSRYF